MQIPIIGVGSRIMKQVPVYINILLFCILCSGSLFAQNRPVLRISVENTETHVQTLYVRRFSELLSERLEGSVEVRFLIPHSYFAIVKWLVPLPGEIWKWRYPAPGSLVVMFLRSDISCCRIFWGGTHGDGSFSRKRYGA